MEKSPTNEVSDSSIQANVICKYTELTDPGLRQSWDRSVLKINELELICSTVWAMNQYKNEWSWQMCRNWAEMFWNKLRCLFLVGEFKCRRWPFELKMASYAQSLHCLNGRNIWKQFAFEMAGPGPWYVQSVHFKGKVLNFMKVEIVETSLWVGRSLIRI